MSKATVLCLLLSVALISSLNAAEELIAKRIIYVGNVGTERAKAFEGFLRGHFAEVTVADVKSFIPSLAPKADVVLLDWSHDDPGSSDTSPLGARDAWSTPTVLLSSAGRSLAVPWEIIGDG